MGSNRMATQRLSTPPARSHAVGSSVTSLACLLSLSLLGCCADDSSDIDGLDVLQPRENDKIITSSVRVVLGLRTPEMVGGAEPSHTLGVWDPTSGRPEIQGKVCLAIYHGSAWDDWNVTVTFT